MIRESWNTLKRNKFPFISNILGLSVAFTVFTVIAFQTYYDFSYNRSFRDTIQIYRMEYFDKAAASHSDHTCIPLTEEFGENISGIDAYCAVYLWNFDKRITVTDSRDVRHEYTEPLREVSAGFFDVFSPEIIAGDPKNALTPPNSVAIPESIARKLFGNEPALGKIIDIDNSPHTVTLVYKNFPKNCSVKNEIYRKVIYVIDWGSWVYTSYFKLNKMAQPLQVAETFNKLNIPEAGQLAMGPRGQKNFDLIPMQDVYFKSKCSDTEKGNFNTTLSLIAIALLIIGIAYVNFINFATAFAPLRIKQINTQKIMGATTRYLRKQIILEAALVSLLAFGLSLLWTWFFTISSIASFFTVDLSLIANLPILISIGCLSLLLGILTGIYPAFYMTSFQPALVLKGAFALTPKGIHLRNSLLMFQFVSVIILISVAAFIKIQHSYMLGMNPGFDRENIVYVEADGSLQRQLNAFGNELTLKPEILDYTTGGSLPGDVDMKWGRDLDGQRVKFVVWAVSPNLLRFFNIKMVEGTDFFGHNERGINKIIFNQKFIEKFDIKEVVGKTLQCFNNMGHIVGVAENINFNSTRDVVEPMAFVCGDDQWSKNNIFIKISGANILQTIDFIKKAGQEFSSEKVEVNFLNEHLNRLYQREANLAKLISVFGMITILISLMGIYGLILFNARFKMKEIGIRKVNGATEVQMLVMLNKGFLKLITIAFVLAVPISWYLVQQWLSGFANQTPVYWWVFVLAGVTTLMVTLLTVSYQSWRAATTNPVDTLKNE